MTGNIVSRRYARALFAIGKEKGPDALTTYGKDLNALGEMLEASPDLVRIFRNPIISIDEKKAVIGALLGKISPSDMVSNFCNLLADKERLSVLPEINADFSSLLDAEQGVIRGECVTAVELNDAKQAAVKDQLEKQAERKLVLDFRADADILGGLVLKVGDNVMDASLRAQLGILKENIKRGE